MMLAQEAGDQYGTVFGALSREQQDSDLQPDRLRRADADADYAETRAEYAPAQQQEQLRGRRVRTAHTSSLLNRRETPRLTAAPQIGPGADGHRHPTGRADRDRRHGWRVRRPQRAMGEGTMIYAMLASDVAAILDLHACGLTLADQWRWVLTEAVQRTGLPPKIVEADLRNHGFVPTGIELADDEVCEAIVTGAVRRMDASEEPHNHVAVGESWSDMAARIAGRIERISSGATPRERALAEISVLHQVDAHVAARALAHLGRVGTEVGSAVISGASLFIAPSSYTEH
ncbi:MAG TPA: hypothetical protein VF643_14520 [Sphingomonas sp.]|jgi:hypothetical protein